MNNGLALFVKQIEEQTHQDKVTVNTTTTITTEQRVGLLRTGVRTSLIFRAVRTSFGERVVSVAFAQFIRQKTITFYC